MTADHSKAARLAARLPVAERPTARRDARWFGFFAAYFERYFRRHMNALRLARWGAPVVPPGAAPLVIYSNHPAWWDAAVYILAARHFFPDREAYAPIDAAMLAKYRFFSRIGAYGVDLESPRGAAAFLAASADILSRPDRAIFVAAQGRFRDTRARPLNLRAGIARLSELCPEAIFLPMAVEYGFWEERGGEAFLAFGAPRCGAALNELGREERRLLLERDLTGVLDRLSGDVVSREPDRFVSLLAGRAGVGGVYDLWRRLVAKASGRPYDPAHGRRAP